MIRVEDGFIVLNYMRYRDRDYTAAIRQRRLRERKKALKKVTPDVSRRNDRDATRNALDPLRRNNRDASRIAEAEAEAEAERLPNGVLKNQTPFSSRDSSLDHSELAVSQTAEMVEQGDAAKPPGKIFEISAQEKASRKVDRDKVLNKQIDQLWDCWLEWRAPWILPISTYTLTPRRRQKAMDRLKEAMETNHDHISKAMDMMQ